MATTKLFYQTPIGGSNIYDRNSNACVPVSVVEETIIGADEVNMYNGGVFFDTSQYDSYYEANRYLKFTDISGCAYKVEFADVRTSGGASITYLVEGAQVRIYRKLYNPFSYRLASPALKTYMYFTSYPQSPIFTISAATNINAASSTTSAAQAVFTVPSPEIMEDGIYNIPGFVFNAFDADSNGTLYTSGNTDIGKNIAATPVPYYSTTGPLSKPVLFRPYVVLSRSGSGNVNSGATVTIYADIYNKNDGKTSATGGTNDLRNVQLTVTLSGSGFSNGPGTIKYGSGTAATAVTVTGITISRTTNYQNISKTRVQFIYTAPSSTTQGVVTITPTVPSWFYGYSASFSDVGTGNTVSITVNAAAPAARYLPFYMTCEGVYLTANDFSTYFGDSMYLDVGPCTDGNHLEGVPSTMSDGSGHTIFYFSTTTFSSITQDKACAMLVTSAGDYEFSSGAIVDADYTLPTSATLSAFRSAGIFTLEGFNVDPVVGCGAGAIIKLDQDQYGSIFFSAYPEESAAMPLDTNDCLQHLYLRLKLHYQNSSYASGFSRDRTLIYDLASRVSDDGGASYVSGTIGNYYDPSFYYNCATNLHAISDTWGNAQISVMDLAANGGSSSYGGAYISGIDLSTSTSGPWSDLSLAGVSRTFYNRTWILGDIDSTLQSYLLNDEQTSPYTYYWCSMVDALKEPCAQGAVVAVNDQMQCNNCGYIFCNAEYSCCPNCGECKDLSYIGSCQ